MYCMHLIVLRILGSRRQTRFLTTSAFLFRQSLHLLRCLRCRSGCLLLIAFGFFEEPAHFPADGLPDIFMVAPPQSFASFKIRRYDISAAVRIYFEMGPKKRQILKTEFTTL